MMSGRAAAILPLYDVGEPVKDVKRTNRNMHHGLPTSKQEGALWNMSQNIW